MKLSSKINGTRDGALIVVNKSLSEFTDASHIAPTLQNALDNWSAVSIDLHALSDQLNGGEITGNPFDATSVHSPLPRAYQWADGSAYVNHVELVRKARNAEMPKSFWTVPLMYQGGSDTFLNPRQPIVIPDESYGIDMEGEVAVIVDDVAMGSTPTEAAAAIRLIMLVNDVSLRELIPAELGKGFGFFQSKPSTAFSPTAITPDELGDAWDGGRVHLPLLVDYNNKPFGRANAGVDMTFNFGELIAHATKTRSLCAGTIIGSGTVSNKKDGDPGKPIEDGGDGYSCIAEIRMIETINNGKPNTPFMSFGDRVQIQMMDNSGNDIFGAIDQVVEKLHG